ncbi:MAG: MaoC/PaaZ C-terminal domain-containing protein [Pseudomonadota bacterium]
MSVNTKLIGEVTAPFVHTADARWLMSYAAGLDDLNPRYMDTVANTVIGHPLFPVCLEWPVILGLRHLPGYAQASDAEAARGVHAEHDLHIYRPISAGERLTTTAEVLGLDGIRPGAAITMRLDTRDEGGELVARTYQLTIMLGVTVEGEPKPSPMSSPDLPSLPQRPPDLVWQESPIPISGGAAHTYTECARIWNPIHTDREVALAAGLPDIILHGTATLALAVSTVVHQVLHDEPQRVRRIGGRFRAMVPMPNTLRVRWGDADGITFFDVFNAVGEPAVEGGFIVHEAD